MLRSMNVRMLRTVSCLSATALLLVLSAATTATAAPSGRVVGGTKVPAATFAAAYASTVSVQASTGNVFYGGGRIAAPADVFGHTCGGTLIAPTLVVTAAHCIGQPYIGVGTTTAIQVLTGTPTLARTRTKAGRYAVRDVYVHPRFAGTSSYFGNSADAALGYDVAVLRLASPVTGITPMPLVSPAEDAAAWGAGAGDAGGGVALGWGITSFQPFGLFGPRSTPIPLRSAPMTIRSDRRCERSDEGLGYDARNFDRATMLCAGATAPAVRAVCFGDSGGPLLAPVADGSLRLVGIASWTSINEPCQSWSVFARIATLRDWINSIPAESGGADNLQPPTGVTTTRTDAPDELRVTWSAPTAGSAPTRYRVFYRARLASTGGFFGLNSANPVDVFGGVTDADQRSVTVDGIEPQRRGQSETRSIRVDSQDAIGNRVSGDPVTVAAPVDARAPSRPGVARVTRPRRGSHRVVSFTRSTDNDCVDDMYVQLRVRGGGWRTRAIAHNTDCDRELLQSLLPGIASYFRPRPLSPRVAIPLRSVAAGSYAVRILAVDRAGNATASATSRLTLAARIPGGRLRPTCIGSLPYFGCTGSADASSGAVSVVIG
ncbi:MAG: peptidase and chymotrypsin/Hap [Thermoleophilia bacterium]|nr:peptidase and chymotrypsin/Hap [Thermoleophilia bacterium]